MKPSVNEMPLEVFQNRSNDSQEGCHETHLYMKHLIVAFIKLPK